MSPAHSPGFLKVVDDAKTRIREIDVPTTWSRLEAGAITLVDVREDREWDAGHAKGAIHVGKGVIERDIEERVPDKSTPLVLYCGGGFRSALAADVLRVMGYTRVLSMAGGIRAWREAGLPESTPGSD